MVSSIILCGGKNTRLLSLKKKITKPLLSYKKKSLLEHHLINLNKLKIKKIFINTFRNKKIYELYKKKNNLNFDIINEKKLNGTAGVIITNLNFFTNEILILYGDNYLEYNIENFYNFFKKNQCDLLIGVFKKKDLSISGHVEFNKENKILNFREKDDRLKDKTGYCNAGIYLIKKNLLRKFKKNIFLDFGKDIFSKNFFNNKCKVFKISSCIAFDTPELFKKNLKL